MLWSIIPCAKKVMFLLFTCLPVCLQLAKELLDILMGSSQAVRVGSKTSSTITRNTGPQGCLLSPPLFTLLTQCAVTPTSSFSL